MNKINPIIAQRCDFAVGDVIDGRWTVQALLGEGTYGKVFRVTDADGTVYALKLLKVWEVMPGEREGLLCRFDREYDTSRIVSRHLVHALFKGIVEGNPYMVMEYCDGGDLWHAATERQLDLALLARQILEGLGDLHRAGRVHRDLKPENVLLRNDTWAMLTDFGISGDQNNRMTRRGWSGVPRQRFGTVAYMPPEQLNPRRGNATVLPTTDIFSFGVMMYQLLTRTLPFGHLRSDDDMARYVLNVQRGQWNRDALRSDSRTAEWLDLIESCLVPDFKCRIGSAEDVARLVPGAVAAVHDTLRVTAAEAPAVADNLVLEVTYGDDAGRTFDLASLIKDVDIIYIGREDADSHVANHIQLHESDSAFISRRHCTIEHDASMRRWIIRDGQFRVDCPIAQRCADVFPCATCTALCDHTATSSWHSSLNGTFVNSDEVDTDGHILAEGDIISIGDTKIRVESATKVT